MASSGDIRKDYIIATIGNHFQEPTEKLKKLYVNDHLNDFLDAPRSDILCARKLPQSEVILDVSIAIDDDDNSIILFFKISPDPITPDNMHKNVLISTMVDSPVTSLYYFLSTLFMPALMKNSKWSQNLDSKTTTLMVNLEKTLANTVRHQTNLNSNENAISSLDNEEHIWQDAISNARTRDEATAAEGILEIVKGINAELKSITDWTSGVEIFENIKVSLLDLWNMGEKHYSEIRILQILSAIGNTLVQNIQESLKSTNAFSMPYHEFEKQINWGIAIMSKTIQLCNELTGELWPKDATRTFKGPKHIPHLVVSYSQRLNELQRVRTVHRQLTLLVSVEEYTELKSENAFAPFSGMNPYLYNSYTEPLWQAAISKFEKLIAPAEQAIANKLKSRLSKDSMQFDLLSEFKRYMELIERPKVSAVLRSNRETLLLNFITMTEKFDENLEARNFPAISSSTSCTSEPINNIYHLKHMKARLKEISEVAEKVLKDLPNYPTLLEKIHSVSETISSEEKRCFKDWSSELLQAVRRNEVTLRKDDPVIEFAEGSRQMEVTYNGKLVQISEEAQQLLILGYRIPREVVELVSEAKKFVRQAQQLDQIATFHNTIGDRMIPSQRAMMLETAVALSKMVQEQNGIVWSNTQEVDKYINSLKQLVTSLARQNNQLSALHIQIKEKVMSLFETDLIKQQQKWKEVLKQIRSIIKDVEAQGYKNMKSWKNHWDRQLYKALEVQFLLSLSSINENLPEVQAELVYRQGKLQFKPALEELKQVYYGNIRKFLNIPNYFKGVSEEVPDSEQIFPTILKRHGHRFEKIYRDGEALFDRLLGVQGRFVEWIALGSADIETLSKKYLVTAEDWDKNFRVSKNKGQEIIRLNCSDEKIGCFVVSYKLLRLEIELLNRKYWEILVTLLNNSIIQDMVTAERFLQEGIEKLKEDPQSVEEITKANQTKEDLALEMPTVKEMIDQIEKKNKTLVTWTKEKVDLTRVRQLWDAFNSLMENHQHIIGRQVENLKINLQSQARQVNNEMEHFKLRWDELKPVNSDATKNPNKFDEMIAFINQMKEEWAKLMEKQQHVADSCERLHVDNVEFPFIEDVDADLASISKTWEKLAEFRAGLKEFEEEDWIIFRAKPYRFEEFLQKWDETFRAEPKSDLIIRMLRDIESYSGITQNLKFIRGDIFSEKHWYELYSLLEMPSKPLGQLKVGDFLQVRETVGDKVKELKELNTRASGEIVVQQALNELDGWEIEAKFNLIENKDSQNRAIPIIQDFKSVLNKLGDNQSLLQSIRTSPFYANFADRIAVWETRLADIDEYLQSLNKIQRRWVYLEPIFSHGVLESEQQRFRRIDDDFRLIMDKIKSDNRVVNLCKISGIRNRLNMLLDQLARCQSSLNEFLERKRSGFPRFYFIGDDDLLEILGQSTKPAVIQAHLKKLFAGIYNVEFDSGEQHITAMKSLEGEVVPLKSKVKIVPNVEEWLSELSNEMKYTLKSSLLDCISDVKHNPRDINLDKYPAQILCLGNSIVFTERCEDAIRSQRLQEYLSKLKDELHFYTNFSEKNPKKVSDEHGQQKVMELKLKDLILDIIHEMDVVEYLIDKKTGTVADWSWQKQLRFYIRDDGSAVVRMADAEFLYSYEYQGNAQKLVHTPLTDKCYLTLTQGMRMGLGGNPYGPAGTGKTESVKALGGLFGRQVLVFNCDEGIDVKAMGRIFIGLSKCGAWGCFDEFNRLEGATLSAVSMQIQPIQTALKQGAPSVVIMDEMVPLDPNAGIFVTLNPAGKGYGGRNKLPDNLKQLFRPVVMSQPDNERIAEVILYTEGYKGAKKLGKKLVEIFNLSGRLLTPQTHYDWGLRALKTVLKGCGTALKDFKSAANKDVGEKEENDIVVSTLRLNTLPKLTHSDCFRFDNLIKDVFPSAVFNELGHQELTDKVKESCTELHLAVNENQVRKCLELWEQLQQRMGVVIVGPPGCGKSTVVSLLKQALIKSGQKIKTHIINPKAMPRTHLLGHINLDTRQWTDGVLTMKAQQVYSEPQDITSWIICDGDVDPEWVESLNSVLDDNRLLTLPSGWRIKFGPNVNFIFETHDLSYASPATISRMGMIFMSDEDADIKGIVATWLADEAPEHRQMLNQMIDDYFYDGLKWVLLREGQVSLPTVSIVKNALSLMWGSKSVSQLAIAMIRGLGGHLSIQQAVEFSKEVFSWTQQTCPGIGRSINFYYNRNQDRVDLYQDDDLGQDSQFEFQVNHLPLVRTGNVKRVLDHIKPWLENQESFILIGPEGCGKSMILDAAFNELRSTEVATIHCSGLITPENVLQKLQQVCITISTNSGRVYKSKDGERLILYFKGVNLVKPDKWGTCQLVEFLQQILSYDGFYDKNLEWVGVRGIQIVASISVGSSGGIYTLSPRFLSRLRVCTMTQPEPEQLFTICNSYLSSLVATQLSEHPVSRKHDVVENLAQGMVTVYKEVRNAFTPVHQSHYQFTPRDLTKWVLGLMRYDFSRQTDNEAEAMKDLYGAWAFEGCRIFRDKLVSQEEKSKFDDTVISPVLSQWNMPNVKNLLEESCWISGPACFILNSNVKTSFSPLFGNVLYKVSLEELITVVGKGMIAFGRENRELNIVVIPELLNNVAYIDRIMSFPCSSLVLAGRAGVGRRTALSIVSALQRAQILTLKVGRNYNVKAFKNDLKAAIQMSAVEGNKVFLVVEDFQLVDKVFLDMLNSLLSSGEIPGLYSPEELETIIATLRDSASADGYNASLYSYFAFRVRRMMQIILIMDYTNENFIANCQSNPAIYKQCNMLWLDNWTPRTQKMIPLSIIKKFYEKTDGDHTGFTSNETEKRQQFTGAFKAIWQSLPKEWTYPRRFVALIHNYAMLYNQKRVKIVTQIEKLKAGVAKLNEAKVIVESLKANAAVQEETLAEKQSEANKALEMITITMKSANMQRGEMEELKKKTLQENEILLEQKKSIDAELKEIEPMVQMAKSAVGSIKNEALSEIRSLRAPPDVIRDILEGVLRLMGIRDMSWNSMKTFLAKRGVKDDIRNFDARNVHPEDREAVEKLLRFKQESFEPKYAKRASAAAAPLAEWVIANVKFSKVLEKIEPLEKKQRQLEENLRLAESQMGNISSELMSVDEKVQQLKEKLNQYTKEAAEIEFHLSKAKGTLLAAEGLVGKLDDEFGRWKIELQELDLELDDLPMNSLLAAAFITYLCDASEDLRLEYLIKWGEELNKPDFDFCKFLSSERDLLQWQALGLPSDRLSQENAIMIFQTCSRPFLIDPSSRATEWLKNFLSLKRPPTVISLQHPNFQNELELAVRFGKILVVLEADIIEPILVPILRGDLVSQGSREVVQIADKIVDYNPDFRLFLCTRTPNPVITPDAAAVLTVVNFTTTRAGLTSQLLSTTLSFEKPEIETKKKELVKNIESLKIELSKLGESLLHELANAQGNILENKELLESLNKTKANSLAITESLAESSQLEEALNNEISGYLPFAEFGSCLYFAIIDTSKLSSMYQFSLNSFSRLFERALKQSKAAGDLTQHITHLSGVLESLVYEYVCRSLFKADRVAFAIHLAHAMHPEYFLDNEWEAFTGQLVTDLKGGTSSAKENVPSWIDEDRTFPVYLLSLAFPDFYEKLNLSDQSLWEGFISSTECEEHMPQSVRGQITNFQKLMLIQTLRPDRLHTVMSDFARAVLGRKTLFPPPTNLRQVVKETVANEPILILVSAGADPSSEMRELAYAAVGAQRYIEISMGQGQIDMALEKVKQGAQVGHWICMKNLHLVTHWLDTLEKEVKALTPHENFRLWLTTEPHPQFPKILLQSCLKVAYEAPPGLKKNLQRTYGSWTPQYVVGDKNIVRTQSLFVLALFHAVVQERRTYIPQGWSKFYEFNESDLRAGADVLDQLFKGNRSREIQWPYVHGLFEQAIYGGRIDNDYDLRVLISYLNEYFNEGILTGANPSRRSLGPAVKLPNTTDIQEYYRLIESMPEFDRPSSFGLPSNIERSWQRIVSSQVIGQLKTLSRRFSDIVRFDKAVWHQELTPLLNLWKKLNQGQGTMGLLQEKLQQPDVSDNDSAADPIEAFVKLEYYNVVSLMQAVHRTLGTMSKVIRGILVPAEGLLAVADSLLKRETPSEWLKKWEGPSDAMSYLQGIVTRAIAIQKWKSKAKENSILRNPVDLSDLLNPDTFLSAFKQHCARKLGVAMDELVFVCAWDRNTVSAGKLSCQITGLQLEGCSFNGVKLVESTTESAPITRVGDCTIAWMSPKDGQSYKKSDGLTVPLYYNETRQKLIGSLEFPSQSDNSKWIQAGVALFLRN